MKCPKCGTWLTKSNITYETCPEDLYYNRFFCFQCDTLYDQYSQSGDYVEEYLNEMGEINYR